MRSVIKCVGGSVLLVALVACSGANEGSTATSAAIPEASQQEGAPSAGVIAPSTTDSSLGLPDGLVVPFQYNVVMDRTVEVREGLTQRRIVGEVFGNNLDEQEQAMQDALSAAGYKAGRPREQGATRTVNYRKDGEVRLAVSFAKEVPERVRREGATGTMRMTWNQ